MTTSVVEQNTTP